MQGKHIVYVNIILEICVSLAIKIKCKHKFMFLAKPFEHVSSLTLAAFGCYSMLYTLPFIFKIKIM